jgi:hypothetical protein
LLSIRPSPSNGRGRQPWYQVAICSGGIVAAWGRPA